ncbi:MAG: V-type ATPase 116kDa subunit family protein [Candidatus Omnitrophica bacterium]|nr:V-type ATPase 116kDa subunit family protein [Candidatus Omnitrophota bacterium]
MFTAEAMELITIAVLKEREEGVVSLLLRSGVFHPVDIRGIEKGMEDISQFQIEKEHSLYESLQSRLRDIAKKTGMALLPKKEFRNLSYEEADKNLGKAEEAIKPLIAEKEDLVSRLNTKEAMLSRLEEYVPFSIGRPSSSYSFLKVEVGSLEEKNLPLLNRSLKDIPHIVYPFKKEGSRSALLFIGLRRDRELLDKVLRDLGWIKLDQEQEPQDLSREVVKKIKDEIDVCKKDIEAVAVNLRKLKDELLEGLSDIETYVTVKKSLLEAKKYSCITEKTALISGWVPGSEKEKIIDEVKRFDPSSCIEERMAEDLNIPKDEIPVKLRNTRIFRPFELLIDAYGIPRYGTIDPTIFVAISFLIMFGAMFGDLGHGLVLSAVSLFLWKSKKENVKQAGTLIFYCGISSELFGILYGSFFGYEFPSLWIKPMHSIIEIFKISILFGIVMITGGIFLNVVNAFKDRDYIKAFFDKSGLIAGVIYWTGIALVSKMLVSRTAFQPVYVIIFLACAGLLFLKPLVELIVKKKREPVFTAFMESTIDILEIVMGYLANTVSFIRIAAFALAHTGLFLSIFELSRIMKGVGGTAASLIIIVFGNILIILLEGLVVSIQSLRLNYYEFFSKFFMSGKRFYKPLKM